MKSSPQLAKKRRRGRGRKPRATAQPRTTITSLGDDVLSEILIRLPSPPSLGRAALACPRWRSLTTSGDFVHRFRALHPEPPFLGCFVRFERGGIPAFHRAFSVFDDDRHLAAVVGGGDFFLTSLSASEWGFFKDCRRGLLLSADNCELAVFDPMSRRRICFPSPDFDDDYNARLDPDVLLPSSDGASFRVISLEYNERERERVRAHEYKSSTGKWRTHPWAPRSVEVPPSESFSQPVHPSPAMHAAGRIYWKWKNDTNRNVLLSLDTESKRFCHVALPPLPSSSHSLLSYALGETGDGACCLACVLRRPIAVHGLAPPEYWFDHTLQLWLRNEEVGSWEPEKLDEERLPFLRDDLSAVYHVAAVFSGIVLLHSDDCYRAFRISRSKHAQSPSRSTSLKKVSRFCGGLGWAFPYLMEWPLPSLSL